MVGGHGEAPHVGVPAECADMTCNCSAFGSYHLVMIRFAIIKPDRRSDAECIKELDGRGPSVRDDSFSWDSV